MKISVSPWYKILYQGTGCSTGKRLPQITSVFASFACPLSNFYAAPPRLVFFFLRTCHLGPLHALGLPLLLANSLFLYK
jgi:hypothetical protein